MDDLRSPDKQLGLLNESLEVGLDARIVGDPRVPECAVAIDQEQRSFRQADMSLPHVVFDAISRVTSPPQSDSRGKSIPNERAKACWAKIAETEIPTTSAPFARMRGTWCPNWDSSSVQRLPKSNT
jgi:hypothetical protein